MTLYYTDPELSTVALKSRTISDEHIVAHDIDALPGTVEADIGASAGFLATLSGAVSLGNMKAILQAGTAVIGKLAANAGVNIGTVELPTSTASTCVSVAASVSVVTLLASNSGRAGAIVVNNGTTTLYLRLGAGASLTLWSVPIEPGGTYEMPRRYYTGIITGIWAAGATGDAKVTEVVA